jgi:hypothetical protein
MQAYNGQTPPPEGMAPDQPPPPADAHGGHGAHMRMNDKFAAANVTHDGRLTQQQAQAGGMRAVARHFAEIDRDQKGYVTLQDVKEWHRARHAEKAGAAPGASPRAGSYPPPGPPAGAPPGSPPGQMAPPPSGQQY